MKIAIISGSHRPRSQSGRVANYLAGRLRDAHGDRAYVLDLGETPLPLWDPEVWVPSERWVDLWSPISAELKESDAIVVIAPEWGGMVPPALKNIFLLCNKGEMSHKPGLIVAVSASRGGAYPVSELRASSYKNTQLCYIPEHVILREVGAVLSGPEPASEDDAYLRRRIDYALALLRSYADALRQVRASGLLDPKTYPFGM
jgi:NAD(P)H-dependent FMN reductase